MSIKISMSICLDVSRSSSIGKIANLRLAFGSSPLQNVVKSPSNNGEKSPTMISARAELFRRSEYRHIDFKK